MNALVNYGTDSDSDDDSDISPTPTHTTNQPAGTQAQSTASSNKDDDEDDPILAALKDLQDFAASVNENDSDPSSSNTAATSDAGVGSGETMEQDQEELKFLSFLQEIDAIPNPDDDQQPPPPPPPPPLESPKIIDDIPPPPPAPSSSTSTPPPPSTTQTDPGTTTESILQSVQMIYNRLDHISLLPSASTISQDLERRLLEFAVRIVDWKKGGLEEAYFLGQDLANALAQEAAAGVDGGGTNQGMTATLPDFGGIVGSMIQYMFRLEQMATPNGWMAVWDAEDEAYGFQHVRTGLYSPVYPSADLIATLDPPAPTTSTRGRISPTTYKSNSWNYYSSTTTSSSSPSIHTTSTTAATTTAPTINPWAAPATITAISSPQSAGSDETNSLIQSPTLTNNVTKTVSPSSEPAFGTAKKKKRKLDDSSSTAASGDDGSLFDQSIHPSRRAALVKTGGPSPGSTAKATSSSSSSSSSKVMPKKLASLLQKWNEKDVEMSDDDDEDDEDDGRDQGYQDLGSSRTGANSQSLGVGGGDWRERRQQQHYK
ncbi:MAG: hypothetical protein JOS17DRAFT_767031 [Linnemannia elongata]|nr:MAG: hypothetical protein JOS17DRAFT_767031 [Linnemannia elongata]